MDPHLCVLDSSCGSITSNYVNVKDGIKCTRIKNKNQMIKMQNILELKIRNLAFKYLQQETDK